MEGGEGRRGEGGGGKGGIEVGRRCRGEGRGQRGGRVEGGVGVKTKGRELVLKGVLQRDVPP